LYLIKSKERLERNGKGVKDSRSRQKPGKRAS